MRIEPEVWDRLSRVVPRGDQLAAQLAAPAVTSRLHCALDSENRRHLLIPLNPLDEEFHDSQSRGLSVVTRELIIPSEESSVRYIDIECQDGASNLVLDLIGGELADALSFENSSPCEIVQRTLARWRRFWSGLPRNVLSREQLLGLFGELWFLLFWLIPNSGLRTALKRWRGPFGARHDFEWPAKSIEVKTTSSMRGQIHRINGIDQLAPPESGELFVFSLHVREETGATNTLPGLITIAQTLLEGELEALDDFETALIRTGYSPAHDEEYTKVRLRIADAGLFAVIANFPRITTHSFAGGFPLGVETLTYEINLSSFSHLRIASSPEEATVFL